MVVQACKLNLPNSLSPQSSSSSSSSSFSLSSTPHFTSLLFEPNSLSLALMHSDSSFSLYPSLSPFSLSSPPPQPPPPPPPSHTQTLTIPPPISSSTFLLLHPNPNSPNPNPRTLFVVAGPHNSGAAILLRFYALCKSKQSYTKSKVVCTQKGFRFDENLGVLVNVSHGVSVKLYGSVNVLAMYSISSSKIWVFAAKIAEDGDNDGVVVVRLMKCAVIECRVPVWSISVSYGYLILGEDNGVRIFALRPLVKGRVKKYRRGSKNLNLRLDTGNLKDQKLNLPNGVIQTFDEINDINSGLAKQHEVSDHGEESVGAERTPVESSSNGHLDANIDAHQASVKLRSVTLRQDSGALFVAFKRKEVENSKSSSLLRLSAKAISIQALSPNKFLILDSVGDLHLLHLSNPVFGLKITSDMRQLSQTMKVQMLAVLPENSLRAQTVWISDGSYTVHMMDICDMDTPTNENDKLDSVEQFIQLSVNRAIFAGEKIKDIVPMSANAVLILGQGSVFAYAFS